MCSPKFPARREFSREFFRASWLFFPDDIGGSNKMGTYPALSMAHKSVADTQAGPSARAIRRRNWIKKPQTHLAI
jgi:hypothetical protein